MKRSQSFTEQAGSPAMALGSFVYLRRVFERLIAPK